MSDSPDQAASVGGGDERPPLRVVIVDDDALVRAGLRLMLRGPRINVVAEHDDGFGAAEVVAREQADVVLMDIRMPRTDGIEATRQVLAARPEAKVLVLTTFDADELVVEAIRAGASGFLLKDTPPPRIISAVQAVAEGEPALSPTVLAQVMMRAAGTVKDQGQAADARRRLEALTAREREVADALADGLANAEIASQLHLSLPTVKAHVSSILAKLGAENRVQAALVVHDAMRR
ncbi:response regulator transcription factor [Luteococcus sp. Sow4_B9]|uniref:response regulator transcription factor n=1 Tax=Luteococcus sp. Sow4_B9 TaxID=3438792 RepID=UPI003F9A371E